MRVHDFCRAHKDQIVVASINDDGCVFLIGENDLACRHSAPAFGSFEPGCRRKDLHNADRRLLVVELVTVQASGRDRAVALDYEDVFEFPFQFILLFLKDLAQVP